MGQQRTRQEVAVALGRRERLLVESHGVAFVQPGRIDEWRHVRVFVELGQVVHLAQSEGSSQAGTRPDHQNLIIAMIKEERIQLPEKMLKSLQAIKDKYGDDRILVECIPKSKKKVTQDKPVK